MNQEQIPEVMARARKKIAEMTDKVKLDETEYSLEDEWLYLCVTPTAPGIRAYDYAKILDRIEEELREEGFRQVLIVPAIPS